MQPKEILPIGSKVSNEELLQLAEQRGKIRMRVEFQVSVPMKYSPRRVTQGWQFSTLRGTAAGFDLPNAGAVWRLIRVCVQAIREEFRLQNDNNQPP